MPTKYFAGNSLAAFERSSPFIAEVTTAGSFDSAFVGSSISVPGNSTVVNTPVFIRTPALGSLTTVWLAFEYYCGAPNTLNNNNWIVGTNASGTDVFRAVMTSSSASAGSFALQSWNGTSWDTVATGTVPTWTTRVRVAIKIVCGSSGSIEYYLGGTLVYSGAITSASTNNIDKFKLHNPLNGSGAGYFSQVLVADYDIRDSRFMAAALNGNSASNTGAATGAYSDINETVLDDSTSLTVTAAGNKAGQTHAGITLPPGYIIGAMVINGRGRVNGTITDGKLGVRGSSGTNSSGSGLGYNGGYEPRGRIVTADPDTATNFTESGFNASEIYEEAV